MRALSEAVLAEIRAAVSPTPCEPYRPESITLPFVWLREPSTNRGPFRHADVFKQGLLYIDIFDYAWTGVDALEKKIAAVMDRKEVLSSGDARSIVYEKESAIPVYEEDAAHLTLTYSVNFADMRVYG